MSFLPRASFTEICIRVYIKMSSTLEKKKKKKNRIMYLHYMTVCWCYYYDIPDIFLCYQVVPALHQQFGQSDGFEVLDYGQELVVRALDLPFVHLFPYVSDHVAVEPVELIHSTENYVSQTNLHNLVKNKNKRENLCSIYVNGLKFDGHFFIQNILNYYFCTK